MCQHLKALHNQQTNVFKWPMCAVVQTCIGKDPFKLWNGPKDFNITEYGKFINLI